MTVKRASRGHMDAHPQNDWESVHYDSRFDNYWVDADGVKQQLFFCPWCGVALPPSQRDRWFDELEAMGIRPSVDPIPVPFRSGAWRGARPTPPPPRQGGAIEGRYMDFSGPEDEDG